MPWFMGIYRPVPGQEFMNGFHGFPSRDRRQLLWTKNLGHRVTYGCILLSTENAKLLYDWAEPGSSSRSRSNDRGAWNAGSAASVIRRVISIGRRRDEKMHRLLSRSGLLAVLLIVAARGGRMCELAAPDRRNPGARRLDRATGRGRRRRPPPAPVSCAGARHRCPGRMDRARRPLRPAGREGRGHHRGFVGPGRLAERLPRDRRTRHDVHGRDRARLPGHPGSERQAVRDAHRPVRAAGRTGAGGAGGAAAQPKAAVSARERAAGDLGVELGLVDIVSAEKVQWPDACLGAARPGRVVCANGDARLPGDGRGQRQAVRLSHRRERAEHPPRTAPAPASSFPPRPWQPRRAGGADRRAGEAINIQSAEPVQWPDACLGIASAPTKCAPR